MYFIVSCFDSVFPITWLHHPIKSGTIISRCRRDAPNLRKESFGCKKAKDVHTFQRASIPYETVFYGSVGDSNTEEGDMIALLETSKMHRNRILKGKERIAVSHWIVTKDIDMVLICHNRVFADAAPGCTLNFMQKNYKRKLHEYPSNPDGIREFDILVEFVSSQFAQSVSADCNYQYMISAFFAHNTLSTEPGIIYPSTQVESHFGFNVALNPEIVNSNLRFLGADWHVLYKTENYQQFLISEYSDGQIANLVGIENLNDLEWIF